MNSGSRQLLAGRFTLDSRIGAGNYAEVFRATDKRTGNRVAIKTLRPEHQTEIQSLSLFEKEGRTGSAISHANVVKISSYGENDGTHYIVMELVKGISLRRRIQLVGALEIGEALRIICGVLRGLEAIHERGYIHRDIKPQNILIDANGVPKITDFGIALSPGEPRNSSGGLAIGTAAYIAPEQAAGQDIGPEADLYSAGAVLFEMLTGEAPFPGDDPIEVMNRHLFEPPCDPRTLNKKISPALSAIVLRSLAKEPAARFRSAQRMREALEMLQEEEYRRLEPRRSPQRARSFGFSLHLSRSRPFALRISETPLMTTFVSVLLLIVLLMVLVLAMVSSAVKNGPSSGAISSSGPPTGAASTTVPAGTPKAETIQPNLTTLNVPNWTVAAALAPRIPTIPSDVTDPARPIRTIASLPPSDLIIYNNVLASGWYTNLSWNGSLELLSAKPTRSTADPISFTATGGWAGLQITNDTGVSTKPFTAIQFSIRSTKNHEPVAVYLRDSKYHNLSNPIPLTKYGGYPVSNSWTVYTIPLADLNASNVTLGSIVFHNWSDSPQAAIYVDHVELIRQP